MGRRRIQPRLNVSGILYNKTIEKEMENKMSNINKTDELLENLVKSGRANKNTKYAYAFGWVWAVLTDDERQRILDRAKEMVMEKN